MKQTLYNWKTPNTSQSLLQLRRTLLKSFMRALGDSSASIVHRQNLYSSVFFFFTLWAFAHCNLPQFCEHLLVKASCCSPLYSTCSSGLKVLSEIDVEGSEMTFCSVAILAWKQIQFENKFTSLEWLRRLLSTTSARNSEKSYSH